MVDSGIYEIKNQTNGKRYIGSAVCIARRWAEHCSGLRRGQHDNQHLQRAFDKYGETAFVFSVLERVVPENLVEHEQHYLDTLNPEYNVAPRAGSNLGFHHSLATCEKISQALMGHPASDEARRNMSAANKGRPVSEETRAKIREANIGKHLSKEHRRKIGEAQKGDQNHMYGKHPSMETRRKNSEAQKGKQPSTETRAKISKALMGHEINEETRRKISEALKGKRPSQESRKKMSIAQKARWRRVQVAKNCETET